MAPAGKPNKAVSAKIIGAGLPGPQGPQELETIAKPTAESKPILKVSNPIRNAGSMSRLYSADNPRATVFLPSMPSSCKLSLIF
jgi:hypothetical protein